MRSQSVLSSILLKPNARQYYGTAETSFMPLRQLCSPENAFQILDKCLGKWGQGKGFKGRLPLHVKGCTADQIENHGKL